MNKKNKTLETDTDENAEKLDNISREINRIKKP